MEAVLLSIHLIVAIALVGVILMQRSEGGALGIGGGPAGMMTARSAADLLTKTTRWLAVIFLVNSLALGWLAANREGDETIVEQAQEQNDEGDGPKLPELPTIPDGDGR
ncbi:preprotein translocase subunit SecG [Eilatimonas milleporae]|uniref:Protein-export membrane protein SecG n=1 Tax=Eilatimonas milleporae TaxID=911205 RepID=A0A3M0CHG9_9PROT|nr:preprotein translocase subunit SecG [Eilatimonas milleporae]RMB08792.1 protein translocase subunit secG [Eilatimonas milleporae]